jgi:hypothetical protein
MLGLQRIVRPKKNYPELETKTPFTIGISKTIPEFTPDVKFSGCTKNKTNTYILLSRNADTNINKNVLPREYHTTMEGVLATPGYYAWILFEDGSFAAARTFSSAEIFSKHGDLYILTPKPVIAAGECHVDSEKNVVYNFESGTFMADIRSDYNDQYPDASLSYDQFYDRHIAPMWIHAGAKSVKMDPAFQGMIRYGVKMNAENIRKYRNAGFTVRKFKSKKNCNSYNSARSKHRYESKKNTSLGNFNTWYASQSTKVVPESYFSDGGRRKTRKARK